MPTVGKLEADEITFCRIKNTLELIHIYVSENLIPRLVPEANVVSAPFTVPFDKNGNFADWEEAAVTAGGKRIEVAAH